MRLTSPTGFALIVLASIAAIASCAGSPSSPSADGRSTPSTGPRSCGVVTQGRYQLRVWNALSESADLDFIDVAIPGVSGYRAVPFSALIDPSVCEVFGLPSEGTYSMTVRRRPNGRNVALRLTFDDNTAEFTINGRRASTLRLALTGCSARDDGEIQFLGRAVYTLCLA